MKLLKKKLKNGMTVVMERRDLDVVSLGIANRFGGACEKSEIKGISHFIEHLVFTGTKTRTHEDISREIEKKGGILNAFTANQVTCFWFKLPSKHIFSGLTILSDMLNNPLFDEKKFEKEKKVILEEIKMYHDNPRSYVFEMIERNLYDKPFGEGIIGNEKSIIALNRDFVFDFFKKNYNPENYTVVVVGNADFKKICEFLEKNFVKGKGKPKIEEIKLRNMQTSEERAGIDQAHFVFAIHAPKIFSKDYYALEVLDAYLADGMSSKLFLKIREERGLAYTVKGAISSEKNYSYYSIYVGTTKDKVEEVKKLILEGFDEVKNMTERDLKEAKERLIGMKKVSSEESSNVMNVLLMSELVKDAREYEEYEKNIAKVKFEDVKKMAKIKEYSTATVLPK